MRLEIDAIVNNASLIQLNNSIRNLDRRTARLNTSLGNTTKLAGKVALGFGAFNVASMAIGAVFNELKAGLNVMMEFEKNLSSLKAVVNGTEEDMQKLSKEALRLGASTVFTANEVAKLQVEFAKFGFSSDEILNATEATLDLAAATGSKLDRSAKVAAATIRGLGLSTTETTKVVDIMAKSFTNSALDIQKWEHSMKFVAPIAAAAGVDISDLSAMLATLADAGISGSNAGTALRRILSEMAKTGKPAEEALKNLAAEGLTLNDAFDEVGRTAQSALLILTENTDKIEGLTTAFRDATGEGKKMAEIKLDNLAGDITLLSSAMDGLRLSIFEADGAFSNFLRDNVQTLTSFVNILTALSEGDLGMSDFFTLSMPQLAAKLGTAQAMKQRREEDDITIEQLKKDRDIQDKIRLNQKNSLEARVYAAEKIEEIDAEIAKKQEEINKKNKEADKARLKAEKELKKLRAEQAKKRAEAFKKSMTLSEENAPRAIDLGGRSEISGGISGVKNISINVGRQIGIENADIDLDNGEGFSLEDLGDRINQLMTQAILDASNI